MNSQRNSKLVGLTLASIMLTVVPSGCCILFLGAGNLESGAAIGQAIVILLPVLVLIGGVTGLVTGLILPKLWWLVILGSQLGWFGGLFGGALVAVSFISPYDPLSAVYSYIFMICCGLVAGLSPALIVSFDMGGRKAP